MMAEWSIWLPSGMRVAENAAAVPTCLQSPGLAGCGRGDLGFSEHTFPVLLCLPEISDHQDFPGACPWCPAPLPLAGRSDTLQGMLLVPPCGDILWACAWFNGRTSGEMQSLSRLKCERPVGQKPSGPTQVPQGHPPRGRETQLV